MHDNPRARFGVVAAALLLDVMLGDPPNRWHPVAWMGTLICRWRNVMPAQGRVRPLLGGGLIALAGGALVGGIGRLLLRLPKPLSWLVETLVLKTTFSLRGLIQAARAVEMALQAGDLPQARYWLGWHLVSRDTRQLNENQIVAATIESLAENLSDGLIAPLFYYRLGGLPAALVYRYLNTCDAMLGYRDSEREWLGKIPARSDDVLNLIPARLTAAGILLAGWLLTRSAQSLSTSVDIYWRDRNKTASPNAGHPMSAMAGALGTELEKVGHYRLGQGLRRPQAADLQRTIWRLVAAAGLCLGALFLYSRNEQGKTDDSI